MPLKKCTDNGKSGWKFGNAGKCFTGPGARDKALRQGRAIKVNASRLNILLNSIQDTLDPKKT